jgi:RNA polymerase sigma factor (sigma-70 family)
MAGAELNKVVEHLRGALTPPGAAGASDGDLLTRYVRQRDEAAFEALVRRHGPVVLGVCRRVLGHEQDAEDAFQATFLVLAKKAPTLRSPGTVGNWLYGVACRAARQARRAAARRRTKEARAVPRAEAAHEPWTDLRDVLDRELERLPAKYRAAVVLCDLHGATGQEAARQLGVPAGTVASRLARGRALLAKRLTRHGLAVAGGALGGMLSQNASAAVPAALVSSTVKAAGLFAAGQAVTAGVTSARVAALAEGVLKAMFLGKLKMAAAVVLAVCVLGVWVGAGVLGGQEPAPGPAGQWPPGPQAGPAGPTGLPREDAKLGALRRRVENLEKQVRRLSAELQTLRQQRKAVAGRRPAVSGKIQVLPLRGLIAADIAKTLKELFATRVARGDLTIAAYPKTNTLLVQGEPNDVEQIEAVIVRLEALQTDQQRETRRQAGRYLEKKKE